MKNPVVILLVLAAWFSLNSCQKSGSDNENNTQPPPPRPKVSITQTPLTILLPEHCNEAFTITNTGPQGSSLNFTVKDDGALQGFLTFSNASGSLPSGASAIINVGLKPDFGNDQGLIGAVLVLDVYTPQASNFTKIPVSINVKSVSSTAQSLVGTWSGTWSGQTSGVTESGVQPEPAEPVSGTWTLVGTSVDTASNTISGSFTWQGNDAYWDNGGGNTFSTTLIPDPVNETFQLNAANASFSYSTGGPGSCQTVLLLTISYGTFPNYELGIETQFNTATNTMTGIFSTQPAAGNESFGTMAGAKQ